LSNADIIYNLQFFHLTYGVADIPFGNPQHNLRFVHICNCKVLNHLFLNLDPMRKIFNVTALILYVGLTFAYLTMVQMITAQVELPTNTNVTLLNETLTNNTNNTVSNATNDTTEMVENAKP
jgi:hypothetical protein